MLRKSFIFIFILLLLSACHRERNAAMLARLQQWDALMVEQPKAILDSLATVNMRELSRSNWAY